MPARSRGAARPSCAWSLAPSDMRGRREDRVRAAPAVSCAMCTKKCAHEHTGPAESIRPSLRSGLTAYAALSPETNSSCLRRFANCRQKPNPVGRPSPPQSLTPATGAGTTRFCRTRTAPLVLRGNQSLTARRPPCNASHAQRYRVHRNPHSTYRDDAYAPLHEAGWREEDTDFEKGKADYFSRPIWTTQITLNRLAKFVLTRNAFCGV
jgi:hypothetical protein